MERDFEKAVIAELVLHLKLHRIESHLSRNKLSIKAGITRQAISQIEAGKRIPTLVICFKLARALNKNLSDILAECERKVFLQLNCNH